MIGAEVVGGADSACRRPPATPGPLAFASAGDAIQRIAKAQPLTLASHNQKDAEGFIRLNALRLRTGAKRDRC